MLEKAVQAAIYEKALKNHYIEILYIDFERMNEVDDDRYDLIFMDIQMPKMDGYMTTREIRTLKNNRKANIPIVAMTANAFEEDKKKAFKAGINAHIAKPIDIKTILAVFDRVFGTI